MAKFIGRMMTVLAAMMFAFAYSGCSHTTNVREHGDRTTVTEKTTDYDAHGDRVKTETKTTHD